MCDKNRILRNLGFSNAFKETIPRREGLPTWSEWGSPEDNFGGVAWTPGHVRRGISTTTICLFRLTSMPNFTCFYHTVIWPAIDIYVKKLINHKTITITV